MELDIPGRRVVVRIENRRWRDDSGYDGRAHRDAGGDCENYRKKLRGLHGMSPEKRIALKAGAAVRSSPTHEL